MLIISKKRFFSVVKKKQFFLGNKRKLFIEILGLGAFDFFICGLA